jgi:MFS family permease
VTDLDVPTAARPAAPEPTSLVHPAGLSLGRAARAERLLIPAAFITALGNNVQLIAGALIMIRAAGSMMAVGWLFIAVAAPQALLSPMFGRLADRLDRRTLWIGCDSASALLALVLPVWLAAGGSRSLGIYGCNFALAVAAALFFPASAALVKERVRPERLRRFNADYEMATQAGMLLSATVGGLAVQTFGAEPLLYFNAGTFVVSALCLVAVGPRSGSRRTIPEQVVDAPSAAVPMPMPMPTPKPEQAPTSTAATPIGRIILLFAQSGVVVPIFNALLPVLVIGEMHRGAGTFGAVDSLGSLGFLAATGTYRLVSRRWTDLRIAVLGFLAGPVLLALQPQFGLLFLTLELPVSALIFGQSRIAARNALMAVVEPARAGRAFGLANSGSLAAAIVLMPCVAVVTDDTNARCGFVLLAAMIAAIVVLAAILLRPFARSAASTAADAATPMTTVPEP